MDGSMSTLKVKNIYRDDVGFYIELDSGSWWWCHTEYYYRVLERHHGIWEQLQRDVAAPVLSSSIHPKGWSKSTKLEYLMIIGRSLDRDMNTLEKAILEVWQVGGRIYHCNMLTGCTELVDEEKGTYQTHIPVEKGTCQTHIPTKPWPEGIPRIVSGPIKEKHSILSGKITEPWPEGIPRIASVSAPKYPIF